MTYKKYRQRQARKLRRLSPRRRFVMGQRKRKRAVWKGKIRKRLQGRPLTREEEVALARRVFGGGELAAVVAAL